MSRHDNDHATILGSYLLRLTVSDLNKITQSATNCLQEQLNGNSNSQLVAHNAFSKVVEDIIQTIPTYDLEQMSIIVKHSSNIGDFPHD